MNFVWIEIIDCLLIVWLAFKVLKSVTNFSSCLVELCSSAQSTVRSAIVDQYNQTCSTACLTHAFLNIYLIEMSNIALYVCPVLFPILTVALADRAAWLWRPALAHSWISHQNALVVCIMHPHSFRKCIISFAIRLWHPDSLQSLWRLTLKPFLQYSYSTVQRLSFLLLFLMDNPPSLFTVRETAAWICGIITGHYVLRHSVMGKNIPHYPCWLMGGLTGDTSISLFMRHIMIHTLQWC